MGAIDRPAAEVAVDAALVRSLLVDQHPDLADRPIVEVASGWDNVIFRLGPDLAARLPRRASAVPLLEHERRWLPELAPRLPLPVPVPVRAGRPGRGYPWPWSVTRWHDGEVAATAPLHDPQQAADALSAFLVALHRPAPSEAPRNPYRGGPLVGRHDALCERLDRLGSAVDVAAVRAVWRDALAARPYEGPPVWLHGDLHPANVVVRHGRLAAVLDWGDLTGGDPSADLAVAWMLLPAAARPRLRSALGGVDDDAWARARGWALSHALACLATSADDPRMAGVGAATLAAVLTDEG
jgi:aminoglycoside phosphotransferase (APT) family kinase protein